MQKQDVIDTARVLLDQHALKARTVLCLREGDCKLQETTTRIVTQFNAIADRYGVEDVG